MTVRLRVVIAVTALAAALGGCTLAPRYRRPETPPPAAAYKELADWKLATPSDAVPRGAWWSVFGDATLDALEAEAGGANQNLKAALARLEAARAQTRIARSAYLPSIAASANATRSKPSTNSPFYPGGPPATGNDFVLAGELSYELDLFGRVRSTVSGARASMQASQGDLAALDLDVRAELATDYFSLRGLDAALELLDRTVADYAKALTLTSNRYRGGAAAVADVEQAKAQLETAKTQAEETRLRRAQTEHAIAVLVGQPASAFALEPRPLPPGLAPPALDPGLPSALLERRPDVAAAERRVAAANAGIGAARAAYFPVFTLAGSGGWDSVSSTDWIQAPSRFWSAGPQAVLSLFDAGRLRAQSAAARAAYDEQAANYRRTVLTAYREVEDNLVALKQLARESESQAAAVAATQAALEQEQLRYQGGIITYLEVVTAENAALAARLAAVDIQTRRIAAGVLLVRALGGGWSAAAALPAGSASAAATR